MSSSPKRRKLLKEIGRIGLELKPERAGIALEPRSGELEGPRIIPRQAVKVVTASVFDVVVQDQAGNRIGEATLSSLPANPTVIAAPGGPVTIPSLTTPTPNVLLPSLLPSLPSIPIPIPLPGSTSQQPLSSPPATPLPSDTTSSLPSSTSFPTISGVTNSTITSTTLSTATPFFGKNSTITNNSFQTVRTPLTKTAHKTGLSAGIITTGDAAYTATTGTFGAGAGGFGASPTDSSEAASSSSAAAGPAVPTPTVVGGVVGGLAGVALVLGALLFLLKWYKKQQERGAAQRQITAGDGPVPPSTSHSGAGFMQHGAAPGVFGMIKKMRPFSVQTHTTTDTAPSEKGFQKISGRKIESVLISHGDGYGGRGPGDGNLSGNSFYRDSRGTFGGPGSISSSMQVGPASPPRSELYEMGSSNTPTRHSGNQYQMDEIVTMRPGPARVPVHSPGFSTPPQVPTPSRSSPLTPPRLRGPDGIGRSRPSFDNSRGSKFAEDI